MNFYDYDKRDYSTVMTNAHFHDFHELYFLEQGRTKYFINNKIHFLKEGDMVFIPSGVFHKTSNDNEKLVERHILGFQDSFLDEDYQPYIEQLKQVNYVKFSPKDVRLIVEIIHKIAYEDKHKQEGYIKMQKIYLEKLLILISRLRIMDFQEEPSTIRNIIQDSVTYISKNVTADLSLHTLAAKYNVSPNYFSKQFKHITGIGLNEYINISRITAAEKLLTKTNMPITQVASECGYNDSNYFSAVFKKLKGVTPKKYSMQNS